MVDTTTSTASTPSEPEIPDYPFQRDPRCPLAPAPKVREVRESTPLSRVRIWNGSTPWLITRHADQRALLTDERVSDDDRIPGFPYVNAHRAAIAPHTPRLITNTDAPEHTRLRRTVNAPSLVKRIEAMRPTVQGIVDGLIDEMLAGPNPADLLTAFALAVPSLVIAELLGVPYKDHEFFQENSNKVLDGALTAEQAQQASMALAGYLANLLKARMAEPAQDVLSEMGERVTNGEVTFEEAVSMGVAMLIAGHETTATMISLGTLALLQHPDQLAELRESEDPEFIANAAEELLRYLTIVQTGVRRVAKADIEFGGELIRECLGQSLARLELQVVYGTLYRRIPTLRLAAPIEQLAFDHTGTTYGVRCLPVTW